MVYGKEGCHLCDEVEEAIRSLAGFRGSLTVVDIEKDPALQARYLVRVPVVTVGGKEVFEASMMDLRGLWRKQLSALLKR